jgi:hypothetical protein
MPGWLVLRLPSSASLEALVPLVEGSANLRHAFEGLQEYLTDYTDGDKYYSRQCLVRFNRRHPGEVTHCLALKPASSWC